jgi:hypothetical protein
LPGRAVGTVTGANKNTEAVDLVELQHQLLGFADQYAARMVADVDRLRQDGRPVNAAQVLRWKIALGTEISSIAAGPNAFANVLDMAGFVTVMRMSLEGYWQPKVFGESASPMLEECRTAETNVWQLVDTVLKPEQREELREAVAAWYRQDPQPEGVLAARTVGITSRIAQVKSATASGSGSVFSLLKLDPLSSLDPATRELTQTRLLGERGLYVAQKMPTLLRWQTELLALNTSELPAVQQLVTNSTQLAASAERFASVADQLPDRLSAEREQILKALQSQEKELAALAGEMRQTLLAGSQMSTSLNTTLTTFDALMKRFGVGETNSAPVADTNAVPFRIEDYLQTAAQLEATARQLTELLVTVDQTLGSTNLAQLPARVDPVFQQAKSGGKEVVNHVFRMGVWFVAIVLAAALIYRFLTVRMTSASAKSNSP